MKLFNIYKTKTGFFIIVLLTVMISSLVFANDRPQTIRTKIDVLQLKPRTLKSYANYVGYLKPAMKVTLSSEIAGVIETLNVNQGTKVQKGDILIQINTKSQLLNMRLNKSNYELALMDYERENILLNKRLSTPAKVADLKNKLDVNRLRLQISELDLDRSQIKAPISGIINQPEIEIGEYVRVGEKLLEVLDISKVVALINIPEREIPYIQVNKDVTLSIDALPDESFAGKVKTRGLEADRQSRTFEVEVQADNPEYKLLPGMLVRAKLLKIDLERQVIIPRYTIQEEEHGSFVYIVKKDIIVKRNVTIGISIKSEVQILSGLNFGDLLVETGQQLVSPNEAVKVVSLSRQKID